jgi:uncharacterized protein (DUF58 family)
VLAFSAIRNNDRVGLLLFSDHVELFVPPRRGRRHALRVVREILFFEAKGRGTDVGGALEKFNRLLQRRSVVFLFSDFQAPAFGKQLGITSRRHDLVALPLVDPREENLPDLGAVRLEDAETGQLLEVATGSKQVREAFASAVRARSEALSLELRKARVDRVTLRTDCDWLPALQSFFKAREQRAGIAS